MTAKDHRFKLHRACNDAITMVENTLLGQEFSNVALFLHKRLNASPSGLDG